MLKVIGAGFGRTGTTSLKMALEHLGFGPCYHFTEVMRAGHVNDWLKISNGGTPDWDKLFQGFAATTDWPAANYYKELAEKYPEALVILSGRNPEGWYRSFSNTLLQFNKTLAGWPKYLPMTNRLSRLVNQEIFDGLFSGRGDDEAHAIKVYEAHYAEVRRNISPDRLLEFDVREGWEPLCRFLNVPVPVDTPFPRSNDTARMRRVINSIRVARVAVPVLLLAGVAALVYSLL